jgi:hypothetical protein
MRDEIDRVCRDFDAWIARAKDEAESVYAQRNTPKGGLVFKDNENALVSRPALEEFDENYESSSFTELQRDTLAYVISDLRKQWRDESDQALAPIQQELAFLRGQLDVMLRMGGISPAKPRDKSADIVDLPNWRRRHVA